MERELLVALAAGWLRVAGPGGNLPAVTGENLPAIGLLIQLVLIECPGGLARWGGGQGDLGTLQLKGTD